MYYAHSLPVLPPLSSPRLFLASSSFLLLPLADAGTASVASATATDSKANTVRLFHIVPANNKNGLVGIEEKLAVSTGKFAVSADKFAASADKFRTPPDCNYSLLDLPAATGPGLGRVPRVGSHLGPNGFVPPRD